MVVTGASGWLGQNLVRALAPASATGCAASSPPTTQAAPLSLVSPSVEVVVGDVRDPATVDRLFDGVGTDAAVFHAAAVIHPARSTREFFDVNVGGTQNDARPGPPRRRRAVRARVVELAVRRQPHARATRFTEDSPYNPYLGYGQSKYEAEQIVQQANDRGDLATVMVRAPWFYGPYQPPRQSQFFRAIRRAGSRWWATAPSGARWPTPTTSCRACCGPRWPTRRPATPTGWPTPEPYELREILATVRRALEAEGLPTSGPDAAAAAPGRGPARPSGSTRCSRGGAATSSRCTCWAS